MTEETVLALPRPGKTADPLTEVFRASTRWLPAWANARRLPTGSGDESSAVVPECHTARNVRQTAAASRESRPGDLISAPIAGGCNAPRR